MSDVMMQQIYDKFSVDVLNCMRGVGFRHSGSQRLYLKLLEFFFTDDPRQMVENLENFALSSFALLFPLKNKYIY